MDFNRRVNLMPCYLLFLLILWCWQSRRVPQRHSITLRTWCNWFSLLIKSQPCTVWTFSTSAATASRPNLLLITGIIVISGIAFDDSDCLTPSHLRGFPYDRFELHNCPNRLDRFQLYPSNLDRLSHPGHLWLSAYHFHMIVPIVWTLFETIGMIGMIIWLQ